LTDAEFAHRTVDVIFNSNQGNITGTNFPWCYPSKTDTFLLGAT
jgi:hypothetical protein